MTASNDSTNQDPSDDRKSKSDKGKALYIAYGMNKARKLVEGLTDTVEGVEADGLARALLPIYELSTDPAASEAVLNLIRAAYDETSEASDSFFEYLDRVRRSEASPEAESGTEAIPDSQNGRESSADVLDSLAAVYAQAASTLRHGHEDDIHAFWLGLGKLRDSLKPEAQTSQATERPGGGDQRVKNVMRLGEQLTAILENPETPDALGKLIIDEINEMLNSDPPASTEHIRQNWPRIAEMLLANPQQKGEPNEAIHLDSSGGLLPPIPITAALRDALAADARRCMRDLHAQAVAILEYHFGLYEPAQDSLVDIGKTPIAEPRKESNKDESQG